MSTIAERESEYQNAIVAGVISPDSVLRQYQTGAWSIYIKTGDWNTPAQLDLHALAESRRKVLSPDYIGSIDGSSFIYSASMAVKDPGDEYLREVINSNYGDTDIANPYHTSANGMSMDVPAAEPLPAGIGKYIGYGAAILGILMIMKLFGRRKGNGE